MIQDGKLVFTAPDATAVHCINLRDGLPAWINQRQDNDLFLAGIVKDQVIVVGKSSVRFLRLSRWWRSWAVCRPATCPPARAWPAMTFIICPCARAKSWPSTCRARLVQARTTSPARKWDKENPAPGNLVFYEGAVLSQTPSAIVAYPQLASRLLLAIAALEKDPKNLDKRYVRGSLLLADGQVQQAVADLRSVRDAKPLQPLLDKVQQKLYQAVSTLLTVGLRQRQRQVSRRVSGVVQAAGQRRDASTTARALAVAYHRARIRESQGNLVAAFAAYRQFGSLPLFQQEGVPSLEDPLYKIPTTVWLRGRIGSMFAQAKNQVDQKAALEKQIDTNGKRCPPRTIWMRVQLRQPVRCAVQGRPRGSAAVGDPH